MNNICFIANQTSEVKILFSLISTPATIKSEETPEEDSS